MNSSQRKQLKEAQKKKIDLDLTTEGIAAELGTSSTIISHLFHGHNYYPRYAEQLNKKYGIVIPDTRELRRKKAKAA